jgi:hypothetical protein
MNFEWDEHKNKSNQQKHGIGFEEAKAVFEDDNAIEFRGNNPNELRIQQDSEDESKNSAGN